MVFLIMPVILILFLSRYKILLGRNLSLVMPFVFLFMVYGLAEIRRLLKKRNLDRKWILPLVTALMVLCNVAAVVNGYRYELSYTRAAQYLEEKIPRGAVIYCTSFAPAIDRERYEVVEIGEDISLLPDTLGEQEYYVDVEYATGYFNQRKDYLVKQGGYMYPDLKAAYDEKIAKYTLLQNYDGITYGKEWKYRIGYLDLFRCSPREYYAGPGIAVYGR